jgi:hypothetical protein
MRATDTHLDRSLWVVSNSSQNQRFPSLVCPNAKQHLAASAG